MINRVVLVGRLTRDPELRRTATGVSIASFSIAVDDTRKGPNGEKLTIFMNCSAFRNTAENVVKFCRKGSLVGVDGRLTQRKYVRRSDNAQVTATEISADSVEFLEPKGANAGAASDAGYTPQPDASNDINQTKDDSNQDALDITDDDLPF
jgi:single-strand DNA-binding protein